MKNNLDRLKFFGSSKEKFKTNEALLKRVRAAKVLTEGLPESGAIPHAFKNNQQFETRVSFSDETIKEQKQTREQNYKNYFEKFEKFSFSIGTDR